MKVLKQTRRRAAHHWKSAPHRMIDDDTTGLWAAKRADQARSRELVRSGARTQESMFLLPKSVIKSAIIRRRTDEF
jgi:hypothetical protein